MSERGRQQLKPLTNRVPVNYFFALRFGTIIPLTTFLPFLIFLEGFFFGVGLYGI